MRKWIWIFVFLGGCASTPLDEAERERRAYNEAIDRENWELCLKAYKQNHVSTIHVDHHHESDGTVRGHVRESWAIKMDLEHNNCRKILGEHWNGGKIK